MAPLEMRVVQWIFHVNTLWNLYITMSAGDLESRTAMSQRGTQAVRQRQIRVWGELNFLEYFFQI